MRWLAAAGGPWVALLVLAMGHPAWADSRPPVGVKSVPATTVIEIAEPFPDYVFLESHIIVEPGPRFPRDTVHPVHPPRTFSPLAELDLAPGWPARSSPQPNLQQHVYAVPRAALEQFPDRGELSNALHAGKVPGAGWHLCQPTEQIPAAQPSASVEVRYRVERTADGRVEFTRIGTTRSRDGEEIVRYAVAGIAVAAALAGLGLWLAHRRRLVRNGPAPS
jgi:hypothetical protein